MTAWWLQSVADVRVLRDFKESPRQRHQREQPHLFPLPTCDFDTALVVYRHVNVEGFVGYRLNFYSVPWSYIGQVLPVRIEGDEVIIYSIGLEEIARHRLVPRTQSGVRTLIKSHHPADDPGQRTLLLQHGVFHAPTLKAMAALLAEPAAAKPQPRLAPIQPKGTRPTLFWLFGGATVRPLAEAMGEDQPFIGVGLDPSDEKRLADATTLGEFAEPLIQAIREAQPTGPYFIGGWCTAGILAYEVARKLMEEGSEVALLALVHATNPVHYRRIGARQLRMSKLRHHGTMLLRLTGAARWRYARDRWRGVKDSILDRFRTPQQAVAQTCRSRASSTTRR